MGKPVLPGTLDEALRAKTPEIPDSNPVFYQFERKTVKSDLLELQT